MRYLNAEGYKDVTAGKAIEMVERSEKRKKRKRYAKYKARADPIPEQRIYLIKSNKEINREYLSSGI